MVLLASLAATSETVAASSARTAKRDAIAGLLAELAPAEIEPAVGFLVGEVRQGRIGVGWATIDAVTSGSAAEPSVTILELDAALDRLQATTGAGSQSARASQLRSLFDRATAPEADYLRRLLLGDLRQGALEGVMADAVARAARVPVASVRRAAMLSGELRTAARVALTEGAPGLERVGLTVLRPIQPMLASTADDVGSAVAAGIDAASDAVSVEWKLDGARLQIHRQGADVRIFTRLLNDITERLPDVVDLARALPAQAFVLDAEILSVGHDDRPVAFQDTMSSFGRDEPAGRPGSLRPFVFDVLHVDGQDLIDEPLHARLAALDDVAHDLRIPGIVTADPVLAAGFLDAAIAAGHEGVMVKGIESPYEAGRRGKAWRKVKPVHLFDLVVLAAEWGHGRRRGWLSNLHLGARDPATGAFVMVGKTFKGMTDELLTWQTEALLAREIAREGITVHVRPELVVEIALDGVQSSTRYPGGIAMRFARVKRYRLDKHAADADTIGALQALRLR